MIEEVRNIEWQRCGSLYMTRLGYDNYVNHVVALYAGSDVLSYGKLEIYQHAAVVRRGEGEERIRIFRIYCGGWITLSRIVRLNDDGEIDYNVNYLVAYSYSNYDDEEERDAIVVIQGDNVLIEYIIDGDFIVTARIDENGRICEFPGVIETVI